MDAEYRAAPIARHLGDVTIAEAARDCIAWMHLDQGLRPVPGQTYRLPGAGHRVPLVADATRV